MTIKVICIGKLKEDYLSSGINEYIKRISKYSKIEIIELPDTKIPDNPSEKEKEIIKKTECDEIKKYIQSKDYIISLNIEGNSITSEQFAQKFNDITLSGYNAIDFIIGGSLGLNNEIKQLSNYSLSFSKFTFPHQLFRLILLEQIYRAFKINNNETYHK